MPSKRPPGTGPNGERKVTAFELHLELRALRNELRFLIVLALLGGQTAARVDLPAAAETVVSSALRLIL